VEMDGLDQIWESPHRGLGFRLATGDERLGGGWFRCFDGSLMTASARRGSGRGGEGDGLGEDLGCFQMRRWEAAEVL
jgi:hypothetical protein